MRKNVSLIGILIVALLVVMVAAGCGNKQPSSSVTTTTAPGEKSASPAGEGANALGDLMKKQGELSSYAVSMESGGAKVSYAMKLAGGKPVATRMDSGKGGWILIRYDKKMHYIYSPATKSAMAMPTGTSPSTASNGGMPDAEALKAMVGQKVTSETVDGVDCTKVSSADGKQTYWVEKEHGLPVQVKDGDRTMKFKYEQINSVPDSTFELPAGTKVQEMPQMPNMPNMHGMSNPHGLSNPHGMQGMPNMPKMPK